MSFPSSSIFGCLINMTYDLIHKVMTFQQLSNSNRGKSDLFILPESSSFRPSPSTYWHKGFQQYMADYPPAKRSR